MCPKESRLVLAADGADDIAGAIGGLEFVAGTAGDLGGELVDLGGPLGHVGFGEDDLVGAEGVGFDGVAADC